jgi:hypothetical protein
MLTKTVETTVPLIIDGRAKVVKKKDPVQLQLQAVGVTLLSSGNMARVEWHKGSVMLRAVKIIVRASGRNYRHLARYLLGVAPDGVLWEIFLGVVKGPQNNLFRARLWGQKQLMKLSAMLLSAGLSTSQKLHAIGL